MNKTSRNTIINFLVEVFGYKRTEFTGLTKWDILEDYLISDRDYAALAEYNLASKY